MWHAIREELSFWRDARLTVRFWVRDDDAIAPTPALARLASIADRYAIGIGLAVIPGKLEAELASVLRAGGMPFHAMCHGWMHTDHKTEPGPAEFGPSRPIEEQRTDALAALAGYRRLLGGERPYFVPPFACIAPALAGELGPLGFAGLSAAPPLNQQRMARQHARFRWLPRVIGPRHPWKPRLDAHIDPIDWRTGTARPTDEFCAQVLGELRMRRKGYLPAEAPIGLLLHHLVHDEAIWTAAERLVALMRHSPDVVFPEVGQLAAEHGFAAERAGQAHTDAEIRPAAVG